MRVFRCVCSARCLCVCVYVCVCERVLVDTYLWAHLELLYRVGNDAGGLRNCCAGHARGQLLGRRDLGLGDALPGGWNLHAHAVNMNVEQRMRRSISKELQTSRSANGQQGPTECECVPRGQQGWSRGGEPVQLPWTAWAVTTWLLHTGTHTGTHKHGHCVRCKYVCERIPYARWAALPRRAKLSQLANEFTHPSCCHCPSPGGGSIILQQARTKCSKSRHGRTVRRGVGRGDTHSHQLMK